MLYSSTTWTLVLAISFLTLSYLAQSICQAYLTPLRKLPGPWYAPLTSAVLTFQTLAGRRLHYIHALHLKYGSIVRIGPQDVAVSDLDAFREIHHISRGFSKAQWYKAGDSSNAPGIFAETDPQKHAVRRRLLAQAFGKSYLRQHWQASVREKVDMAVAKIKRDAQDWGVSDIYKWWVLMSADAIGHLAFGESFGLLENEKKNRLITDVDNALFHVGLRGEFPHLMAMISRLPWMGEILEDSARLLAHGAKAITNSRAKDASKATIFAKMLHESVKGTLSDETIAKEAVNLTIAGSDTTGVTLTYLVWAVLRHPDLQARLEAEVRTLPDDFAEADVETLPLLNAVIDETLRLYGAAPGSLPREVPLGGRVLCGFHLPAATVVNTQAHTLHRDSILYADPESFNPERWLAPKAPDRDDKAAFSPFGAGARICLGSHLAHMELRLGTAVFFRECAGAQVAEGQTDEMMGLEHYFLIKPLAHKCLITIPASVTV